MDDTVHFLFDGDEDGGVPQATARIIRTDITSSPESLLSKLASETWRNDESAGSNSANPIVVNPLGSCPDSWSPAIAEVVADMYRLDRLGRAIRLPPKVELEELLSVLDYFGFELHNPADVNLNLVDPPTRLRARLFLNLRGGYMEGKELILKQVEKDPCPSMRFLAINDTHDLSFINKMRGEKHFPIGSWNNHTKHYNWSQVQKLRDKLVADLGEVGLSAKWDHICCCIRGPEGEHDRREEETQYLWRVTVDIKPAEPVRKRRRTTGGGD